MDARQFLAEFGHIVNAPEGVKRLRELILQLAIQGDLSERVLNDIPAEILFESNQNEKRKQISEGTIPRQKPIAKVDRKDHPWDLPDSWKWCRLGEVTTYGVTLKAEYSDVTDETWVLELEDIEKQTSTLVKKIRAKERRFRSSKNRFLANYVLYGKLRPYLDKVVLADEDGVCTTEIMPISVFDGVVPAYLRWYLKSPFFINYANNSTHGMNLPRMGTEAGRFAMFALPPKEEQKRIVAKVDELMALCDKLEAQQQKRRKLQTLTRTTALDALANAQSPHELKDAWFRLQGNLPLLFNESKDIGDLKSLILDLAATGYLSEYVDGDSEPSESIHEGLIGKKQLIASGEIKKKNAKATEIKEVDIFIPSHWSKAKLDELFNFIDYRGKTPVKTTEGRRLVTAKNVRPGRINLAPAEYISEDDFLPWMTRGFPKKGDLLITTEAPLGNVALIISEPDFALAQRVINLQPYTQLNTKFFMYFMMSPVFQKLLLENATGTTAKGIKAAKLKLLEVSVPSVEEQDRVVLCIEKLFNICKQLEKLHAKSQDIAKNLAQAAIASITGTQIKKDEKMKAPKTELVSKLKLKVSPNNKDQAPLSAILAKHNGELSSKALWNYSDMDIDKFYQQLKIEMARDWIVEPEKARMIEKDADNQSEAEAG
ncbi:restriction endonuclease subunit S [Methylobacter sp.]|uniref:restriction endonuclease subunit S n=1 Tax=Methylobacter sp. TaxID=2051955 RepID=UPI003DA64D70